MTSAAHRAVLQELLRRKNIRKQILSELHPAQLKVANDPAKRIALCASRRAGKTHLDAALIVLALLDACKDDWVAFAAPTSIIAKELIWSQLEEFNNRFSLQWKLKEHPTPYIVTPQGARFRLFGLDDRPSIDRMRGKRWKLVIIDETKDVSQHLRALVSEVIEPAFIGCDGRILLSGTPGRIQTRDDFWYSVCMGLEPGWSSHTFTLRENHWVKDPEKELADVLERNGWTRDCAVYMREYEGIWRNETSERVYPYEERKNSVQGLPAHYDVDTWQHVLGCDYGFSPDATAFAVVASHPKERVAYVVHAEKHLELLSEQAADITAGLVRRFKPTYVIGDGGGLGAPYLADFNRRYAEQLNTWIRLADKKGRRDQIEVVGDALRAEKLFLCLPQAADLASQYENVMWKDQHREVANQSQADDLTDATRYAFVTHKHYYNKADPPPLTEQEKEILDRRARAKAAQAKQQRGLLR
jgi:hypothetical protein